MKITLDFKQRLPAVESGFCKILFFSAGISGFPSSGGSWDEPAQRGAVILNQQCFRRRELESQVQSND